MRIAKRVLLPLLMLVAILAMTITASAASSPVKKVIKSATLSKTSYTYDALAKRPKVTVKDADGKTVSKKYYTVKYKSNKLAGTAKVTITGKSPYTGTITKKFTIKRAKGQAYLNKAKKVKTKNVKKTVNVKAKAVKNKAKKVGTIKVYLKQPTKKRYSLSSPAVHKKVSFKSSSKKIKVNKKGVITVKKGTKEGTYKIKVTIKGTKRNYKKVTRTIKVIVA